jgi:hypothetical protein
MRRRTTAMVVAGEVEGGWAGVSASPTTLPTRGGAPGGETTAARRRVTAPHSSARARRTAHSSRFTEILGPTRKQAAGRLSGRRVVESDGQFLRRVGGLAQAGGSGVLCRWNSGAMAKCSSGERCRIHRALEALPPMRAPDSGPRKVGQVDGEAGWWLRPPARLNAVSQRPPAAAARPFQRISKDCHDDNDGEVGGVRARGDVPATWTGLRHRRTRRSRGERARAVAVHRPSGKSDGACWRPPAERSRLPLT